VGLYTAAAPPAGLLYKAEIISQHEECALIAQIRDLPFSQIRMHGVVAKRKVVHFGWVYGYESWKITPGPAIPVFLLSLRACAAELISCTLEELAEVLVTQYPPGAGIGWHRDAPMFGTVVGVSLLNACRLSFQRRKANARETFAITLEPRSAYVLRGPARYAWQHSIHRTPSLRYSVTFRTMSKRYDGWSGGSNPS
jgi:alkylated DNA repair protein (DNA oxidative demethylase)